MGPADHVDITGAKGGSSKPKTPVEAPDSLQSTNIGKILIAVGEGEFDGEPTDRDIYLDNTPIMDASGSVNFPGVRWEWRPGSVEQDYIQGIPAIENETTVNVELRSDNPFARALSNTQLSAVRVQMVWPRLAQQDSSGNTNGYRIEYAIDIATDGGAYVEAHLGAVDGKTTNGYQRSVRVNLPKATSGWMLRVRRITPNANSGTVADTMTIAGYTEIIDQKLRYPNTALLYIEFDAQQFQNIPAVTVKCKAKRWPVPSNYDPVARTYSGVWDGTFKQAWTNNPAFVTYGLCVEDRFGLGKRIRPWMVDKWEMYRIAQYCDQQVPNGQGGQEPRFLCDMNLQGRAEAWTLLRDLSAIYRGMVYWAHGSLFMQADMPRAQDIDYVFTRANVIDGEFVYGGAERNTHYSRALVSYDNPANNYDTDVIPVTDNALQRRYRDRPVEISAIGCTRASEAQRRGKWALLSNSQDRTVTFKTGMEGRIPLPGYVIPVADELVAGRPNGGRISAAAGRVVTLDRDTPIKAGDRLILNLPNGTAQARTVQSVAGRAVTVTTAYGMQPEPELQWAIDYHDLAVQLFRVLKTTRTQEGEYEITALEFNPSKFAAIDTGAKLDERPISVIPVTTVQPPASVTLSSAHMIDQGIAVSTMTIAWPAVEGAVAYDVEWRKDNGNWVRVQRTGAASVDVVGIYAGAYLARVRAVSAFDITSIWKSSALTQLNGKEGLPAAVTFLTTESLLFGIGIKWGFPAGAEDTQRTELWYSEGADLDKATKLADLAYPQNEHVMQGLRAGQTFYFWVRLVDRTGNVGPWYPVGGAVVSGQASADAGPILEQIAKQITETELGKELTERIDLVDKNGPGSVNERVGEVRNVLNEQIAEVNTSIQSVNDSVTAARDELHQQINAVDQHVEAAKVALQQQIAAVDQEVDAAKADLQQQINSVSVLAGSLPYNKDKAYSINQGTLGADGKLYQALKAVPKNNPPPNATYWTDVGQAIVTAAGTAARVSKVETDVTTLDGKTTAQATQLNGLQTSLTTTNQNVTTAQQAAEAANTLAGGKGKVIIQAAAPAVADRLAQNLWIDTTANANTPKRWSGSAWVAVTDKAASDAAAAAASALALAQTKADATVVNNLTLRVSDAEGKLVAEGQRLDGMQTSLDDKATSAALQQVTSRVTATEGKNATQDQQISSQSSAIVSLTDSVAKKAEVSTVQALSNLVNQQGQDLTAQGQALVSINAALPTMGGENLVYNPSFERQTDNNGVAQGWWHDRSSNVGNSAPSLVPSKLAAGVAQRLDVTDIPTNGWARVYLRASLKAIKVRPGAVYTASVYMRGTAGLRILAQVYSRDAAGANSVSWPGNRVDAAETWQRVSVTFTATDQTVDVWPAAVVYGGAGVTVGFIEVDQYQLEEGSQASGWRDNGQVEAGNQAATAAAVEAMSAKVTQQGADLTSVSSKTTSLENSLTTTNGNVTTAQQAAQAASDAAGAKGKVLYQSTAPAVADRLAQNLWIDTTGNANTPKRWNGSTWVAVSDKVASDAAAAAQSALNQVAQKADASVVSGLTTRVSDAEGKLSSQATRLDGMQTSIDGKASSQSLQQVTNRVTATEQKDAAQDQQLSSQSQALVSLTDTVSKKAEAAAVQALSNDVKQQGQTQSAQGKSLTDLNAKLLASQDNSPTKVYQSVFSDMAVDQWANLFGGPTASTVFSNEEGNTSGATIKVSGGAGNSTWWGASTRKIRFDPTRLYKLSIRFKQLTAGKGNPITYAGVDGFAEDGVTRINSSGANTKDSSHYVITAGRSHPIGEWMEFTTHVKGYTVGSEGGGAGAGTVADPKRLKTGIAWISPMLVAGYNNIGGELAVDYFLIEDVTEQAQIDAGATATNALAVRVEKNEQGLSSVSNQAVQLENSLTTTNQNVTNAQNAAQAASNLAGSKGKVIVQRETPAAADQLAQNLWIDITNGANTPKRWTTSGWLPVTDKVAVDAAAAAANALSEVAKKADASALQSLNSKVDQQGRDLTATSNNVVSLGSTIGRALDNSPTKVYQSVFSDMSMDQWVSTNSGAGATASYGAPAGISRGAALILNGGASNRAWWGASTRKIRFDPSRLYKLTVRVQQVLMGAGSPGTYAGVDCFAEDGVTRIATSGVNSVGSSHYVVLSNRKIPQGEWLIAEVYVKGHTTGSEGGGAGAGTLADPKRLKESTAWFSPMLIAGYDNMGGQAIFDFFDIEDVTEQAQLDAGAAATSALGTRITQTEQGLTSASNQLTELNNNIGDVGGENLVFNPSFERSDPGTPGMADGWWHDGTGSGIRTPTLVQSTLASGVAQRLDVSGLSPATWARAYVKSAGRFKPVPGKTYTASVYLRGTPGLRVLPGVYGTNEAGAGTESWGAARTDASESWVRLSVTFTPGPTTTKLFAAFVVYGGASVSGGYIEADRYQIEEGTRVTGWRDNGQVASAQQAATSAAVESLSSTVSQQAGTLSSVGSRTTSLENNLTTTNGNVTTAQQAADAANTLAGGKGKVIIQAAAPAVADRLPQNLWIDTTGNANTPKRWSGSAWVAVTDKAATDAAAAAQSALTQVATKASASSVDALTQRVTSNEGGLASQSSSILDLRNSVAAVQKAADASVGLDPAPGCTWQFDNGAEGWYGANATAVAGTGFLKVTATASNPQLQSAVAAIGLTGALFTRVRARITRRGGSGWRGTLYYATPGHGFSSTIYSTLPNPGLAIGDSAIVEWDMENLNSGGTDWVDSTISRLRLDLGAVSGDVFDVDWIVVGRVAPAASSRALSSVESTVTQQGSKLTAETLRIDGLYTAVGDANAAIQNEAKARVDGEGALSKQLQTTQSSLGTTNAAVQQVATAQANMKGMLNAQYTMRVQVNNQYGAHVWAGFGIGINEQNGVVQSAFVINADKFILLNTSGGLTSPWSVVGGQTFVADAYIRNGSIGRAKIADAAIGTANIEDGAIKAAKIGVAEIDTLRIRGNAVTVPVSASNPANLLGAGVGQWQNLIAVGVQMDEGGFITAQYSCYQGFGSGIRKYQFQMDINGLVIAEGGGDWADSFPNLMGSIGVAPGYFVITVKWWGENSGVGVKNHTLYAMGSKR
ncbi:carbohydrate binding domain-containing protein [Pseudomonas putida]|uniref:TipJ family phage tail tip protein n=1 Tax=Pseudomonas putida TaxID=303 RepID=UPI001E2A0189|nr:carbohydrate binding domain-containing protein [Pseudomonas putida]